MTPWMTVTLVSKSLTSWLIDTFMTDWSSTITNCAVANETSAHFRPTARPFVKCRPHANLDDVNGPVLFGWDLCRREEIDEQCTDCGAVRERREVARVVDFYVARVGNRRGRLARLGGRRVDVVLECHHE